MTLLSVVIQKRVGEELTLLSMMLPNAIVSPFHITPREKADCLCEDVSLFAEHLRHRQTARQVTRTPKNKTDTNT